VEVAGRLGRYHRKESEEVEQREGLCCWVDYGIGERVSLLPQRLSTLVGVGEGPHPVWNSVSEVKKSVKKNLKLFVKSPMVNPKSLTPKHLP